LTSELPQNDVLRRYSKYVFLDVVKFSKRSAEAQSDIVDQLNTIVRSTLERHQVRDEDSILIPTGDGMCIAVLSPQLPFDIHIQIALSILESLYKHNQETKDATRQFELRVGINQNTDIIVTDINSRRNVAGAGINMAARIMAQADGNQILVGSTVYEELQPSERYMDKFQFFNARGKHDLKFSVYQYIDTERKGLNFDTPTEFETAKAVETELTKIDAYYFAHAIKNRQFVVQNQGSGQNDYSLTVMLLFLAKDSVSKSEATEIEPYKPRIYGDGKLGLNELFSHYQDIDFQIISHLALSVSTQLSTYGDCFEGRFKMPIFINEWGKQKLKNEWPQIWNEFELSLS